MKRDSAWRALKRWQNSEPTAGDCELGATHKQCFALIRWVEGRSIRQECGVGRTYPAAIWDALSKAVT